MSVLLVIGLNQNIFLCLANFSPTLKVKKTSTVACACPPEACVCPPTHGCDHHKKQPKSPQSKKEKSAIVSCSNSDRSPVFRAFLDSDIPTLTGHAVNRPFLQTAYLDRLTDINHLSPYLTIPDKPPQFSLV